MRRKSAAVDSVASGRTGGWPCRVRISAAIATGKRRSDLGRRAVLRQGRERDPHAFEQRAAWRRRRASRSSARRRARGRRRNRVWMLARVRPSPAKPSQMIATVPSKPWWATRSAMVWPRTQIVPSLPSMWLSTVSAATTPSSPLLIGALCLQPRDRGAQFRDAGAVARRGRRAPAGRRPAASPARPRSRRCARRVRRASPGRPW